MPWVRVEVPHLEVSSTDLRARVADGRPLDFLLTLGETSVSRARLSAALQDIHTASVRRTLATPDRPGVPLGTKAELHASQQALGQVPF